MAPMADKDKDKAFKVMKLQVGLLRADPQNARTIEAPALRGLGTSMETFGDLSGIVWNERSGNLVAGHQRMNRLNAAGADTWTRVSKTEGFILHPRTGERFGIRIVDWDDTTERMANLTANNPHIQGDFTEEAAQQLAALEQHAAFESLLLADLQTQLDRQTTSNEDAWESDIGGTEAHGSNTDGILARVVVTCPQEAKAKVTDTIAKALKDAGLTEASVG
jgi:hypothetical protein